MVTAHEHIGTEPSGQVGLRNGGGGDRRLNRWERYRRGRHARLP